MMTETHDMWTANRQRRVSEGQAMQGKRTGASPGMLRRMGAMIGVFAMLSVLAIATSVAKDRPRRLPKGVEVVRLPDGSHDVTAKMTSPLPTGEQVQRVPLGDRLEEAARILCPQGHEMTLRDGAKLRIVSGRIVSTQTANVRCTSGNDATTSPAADTP